MPADRYDPADDPPLPTADDPGGAHNKGYLAEPGPTPPVPEQDPVPLASDADVRGHVRPPDEDAVISPTGRDEPNRDAHAPRVFGSGR